MGKVYDGIMGLVVGDALGVPFEFKLRGTFKCKDMIGYGTYKQPPGTWSDDTSMTLATMYSIIQCRGINLDSMMHEFQDWAYHGYFTPSGYVFDIGTTTQIAIDNYALRNKSVKNCGCGDVTNNGNGALMRILPLAFFHRRDSDIARVASLTHSHHISTFACYLYIEIAELLIKGEPLKKAIKKVIDRRIVSEPDNRSPKEFDKLLSLHRLKRNEISSSGYVVDTLIAALWCLYHTNSYKKCVLTAVNLGEDTDTIAAIAGGLAGLSYGTKGRKGIPKKWIEQIARRYVISDLCDDFEEMIEEKEL